MFIQLCVRDALGAFICQCSFSVIFYSSFFQMAHDTQEIQTIVSGQKWLKMLHPEQQLGPACSVLRPKSQLLLAQHSHRTTHHKYYNSSSYSSSLGARQLTAAAGFPVFVQQISVSGITLA